MDSLGSQETKQSLIPEKVITLEIRNQIKSECKDCKFCDGHPNNPCTWLTPCAMHKQIQAEKDESDQMINDFVGLPGTAGYILLC